MADGTSLFPLSELRPALPPCLLSEAEVASFLSRLAPDMQESLAGDEFAIACDETFAQLDVHGLGVLRDEALRHAVLLTVPENFRQTISLGDQDLEQLILSFDSSGRREIDRESFRRFSIWVLAMHIRQHFERPIVNLDLLEGFIELTGSEGLEAAAAPAGSPVITPPDAEPAESGEAVRRLSVELEAALLAASAYVDPQDM
eukprot:gnl/TRDRNA2_/TRDRNA2_127081_c0_seq1.p2 gnl/TRDRNA2_/TRDRNA2_127081_c0~~gnl/TRDRNA2_/TRDRNA2_127081_c0_seq1.p2  ORF type:complete len:202 (+),score=26.76 gnl/TRDRNA2_/TRDRNA2_127081_c0_seq1:137-742(+)